MVCWNERMHRQVTGGGALEHKYLLPDLPDKTRRATQLIGNRMEVKVPCSNHISMPWHYYNHLLLLSVIFFSKNWISPLTMLVKQW